MTRIVGYCRLSTFRPFFALGFLQVVFLISLFTVNTMSHAGLISGISQCIAASESEAPEDSEEEKKKPVEEAEPTDEELEEDCD